MDVKQLQKEVNQIKMSEKMEKEIISYCNRNMEEQNMSKKNIKKFTVKPVATAAALALCLCVTGISAMAATGKLEGFFKDIKRWDGAITGTVYEQASDEVEIDTCVEKDKLVVTLKMLQPNEVPYSVLDNFGIEEYQIVDMEGNVIMESSADMKMVPAGQSGIVEIEIPLDNVKSGEYKLLVTKLIGGSKADQPLFLNGNWESIFTY